MALQSTCYRKSNKTDFIVKVTLQLVMIFGFLTLFFFNYVNKVEKEEFVKQVNFVVDDLVYKYLPTTRLSQQQKDLANEQIDKMAEDSAIKSKSENEGVERENELTKNKGYTYVISFLLFVITLISVVLVAGYCLDLKHDLKEVLIIVLFVALVEFTFLTVIARNYISADPNAIKRTVADTISKYAETKISTE